MGAPAARQPRGWCPREWWPWVAPDTRLRGELQSETEARERQVHLPGLPRNHSTPRSHAGGPRSGAAAGSDGDAEKEEVCDGEGLSLAVQGELPLGARAPGSDP